MTYQEARQKALDLSIKCGDARDYHLVFLHPKIDGDAYLVVSDLVYDGLYAGEQAWIDENEACAIQKGKVVWEWNEKDRIAAR